MSRPIRRKNFRNAPLACHGDRKFRSAYLLAICGEQLRNDKITFEGLWVSFKAKPSLEKLITLYEKSPNENRKALMQQAAEMIAAHLKKSDTSYLNKSWERDDLESPAHLNSTLLLHAYLFCDDLGKAFELAEKGNSLGWSHNNPQPLFIAYCLIHAAKISPQTLPVHLQKFWDYALKTSDDSIWEIEGERNSTQQKLEALYQDLFTIPHDINQKLINWCLEATHRRVEDIVINQHRKAYDRAALVTAACTETLKMINPEAASKFFWEIQSKFPRHSSFQAELGRVNVVK